MSTFKYISQLANSQRRFIDSMATSKTYSGAQGKVIHYLFNNTDKPTYQKDIEKVFGLRASTATELMRTLESQDLIRRVPNAKDARFKEILLTEKAEEYRKDVFLDMEKLESVLTEGIGQKELAAWIKVTCKMLDNLERGMKNEK